MAENHARHAAVRRRRKLAGVVTRLPAASSAASDGECEQRPRPRGWTAAPSHATATRASPWRRLSCHARIGLQTIPATCLRVLDVVRYARTNLSLSSVAMTCGFPGRAGRAGRWRCRGYRPSAPAHIGKFPGRPIGGFGLLNRAGNLSLMTSRTYAVDPHCRRSIPLPVMRSGWTQRSPHLDRLRRWASWRVNRRSAHRQHRQWRQWQDGRIYQDLLIGVHQKIARG